jgi:hypothetical protein
MDIWVDRTIGNYNRLSLAFLNYGMPVFDMTESKFLHDSETDVFTFGRPPSSIDIMTTVKGLNFDECYGNSFFFDEDGLPIRTINRIDLIAAKKATGRAKDINDLENLTP